MGRWLRRMRVRLGRNGRVVLELHDDLEGQLSMEESAWLYHAAGDRRTIVEIGSYRGKSCVLLAKGCRVREGHVTAIDPHLNFDDHSESRYGAEDHEALLETVRRHGVAQRVTPVERTSRDAFSAWGDGAVDLLWVDGDHRYESVRFDLSQWGGLVRVGGLIAAHDYSHRDDVRRAWDEVVGADARFGRTRRVRSIAWAQRVRSPDYS